MTTNARQLDKSPPNSAETERLTLGTVLLTESTFGQIAGLKASHYYAANYRYGFLAMQNLSARNEIINPFTVFEEIKAIHPQTVLTVSELTNWSHGLPFSDNLSTYVAILKDKAVKRDLIRKCNAIAIQAMEESETGVDAVGSAVTLLQDIYSESLDNQKPTVSLAEAFESSYERWDKMERKEIVTIETGLNVIDSYLTGGGFEKGMFHVIGARPGKGKTTLGLDMAWHNACQGKVVVFFTMELSRDVLMDRLIAPLAGIERYKITSQWMNKQDKERLITVAEEVKQMPLFVNHKARTLKDMRLALKEVARLTGGKIDLIVTDFLTKMRSSKNSKYEAVSENANGLAEFAVEFNAASIVLAQLNRGVEKRATTEPGEQGKISLIDFRDSGEIEELGRTILGLWGSDETNGLRTVNVTCLKQGEGMMFDEKLVLDTRFVTFGTRKMILQ